MTSRVVYRLIYATVGTALRRMFRIRVEGLENIQTGRSIFVINHQAVIDSLCFVAVLPVDNGAKFLAKKEYFEKTSVWKRFRAWFIGLSSIPVDRSSRRDGINAVLALSELLLDGQSVAMHPEGTRVPDQRVYRGKTGFVDIAWRTGVRIVPVGVIGSAAANPPGTLLPRIGRRVTFRFGEPVYLPCHQADDIVTKRKQAEAVMRTVAVLADMPYIDEDPPRRSK